MSTKVLASILDFFNETFVDDAIHIQSVKVANDLYMVNFTIDGKLFRLTHWEPANAEPGRNYGHGPWFSIREINELNIIE